MNSIGAETVFSRNKYRGLAVSAKEAAAGDYKRHLGGGEREWDARGAYQLELLRHLGLQPQHRLVDYGCGPLRAGRFLIRYLQAGRYRGYDFNPDFIAIARDIVAATPELRDKAPALEQSTSFLDIAAPADFILLFSVLNHCGAAERLRTLEVARAAGPGTRVCISHAAWYDALDPRRSAGLSVRRLERSDLPVALDPLLWGWREVDRASVFPVIVVSGAEA